MRVAGRGIAKNRADRSARAFAARGHGGLSILRVSEKRRREEEGQKRRAVDKAHVGGTETERPDVVGAHDAVASKQQQQWEEFDFAGVLAASVGLLQ